MPRNIELKSRLDDWEAARRTAASLATHTLAIQEQVDTYFHCREGRLKLRQIGHAKAELIWYARPDRQGPKASDYLVVPVAAPESLKTALAAALGVRGIVRKRREIYFYHNVRIHLDEVEGLGHFLEFEAVVGSGVDDAAAQKQVDFLTVQFGLQPADLLEGSYGEMVDGRESHR